MGISEFGILYVGLVSADKSYSIGLNNYYPACVAGAVPVNPAQVCLANQIGSSDPYDPRVLDKPP